MANRDHRPRKDSTRKSANKENPAEDAQKKDRKKKAKERRRRERLHRLQEEEVIERAGDTDEVKRLKGRFILPSRNIEALLIRVRKPS